MSTVHASHVPPVVRAAGHTIAVVGGGLLLLNLLFGAYAVWQTLVADLVRDLRGPGPLPTWVEPASLAAFVVGVLVVTAIAVVWRPYALGTAIWFAAPTATVLAALWVSTPMLIAAGIGVMLVVGALTLLVAWNRPWEQVLSISWVAVLVALVPLLHIAL